MGAIQKALDRDCCLIFEAMRRLIEGTCCLQGDEQICVWDLFGRLHVAFLEHVEFEELHVLPHLGEEERSRHHSEHIRLLGLIEKARWEFEWTHGDGFRGIMRELMIELRAHHDLDTEYEPRVSPGVVRDPNLQQILHRTRQEFLL